MKMDSDNIFYKEPPIENGPDWWPYVAPEERFLFFFF